MSPILNLYFFAGHWQARLGKVDFHSVQGKYDTCNGNEVKLPY